ncbi:MAG: arginine deiminase [Actinomycetes bacterium]
MGPRYHVDSEVGRLRSVLVHRPGDELKRLTPRNNADLLFDGIPWVARAQEEHDVFTATLRERGVEVVYLRDLLIEALDVPQGEHVANVRTNLVSSAVRHDAVGPSLYFALRDHLLALPSQSLADIVIAGMTRAELPVHGGLVDTMAGPHDFVIPPLPNLLFTRDSSVWVGDQPTLTTLAMPARRRERSITQAVYHAHPRFAEVSFINFGTEHGEAWLEGGDVLMLGPGVVAVGSGQRTTPAGVESFAHWLFARKAAHTVLAVPIAQERATMHLDTVCTMVDVDAVLMYPAVADSLESYVLTPAENAGVQVSGPEPFLTAAAKALGIDTLRVIDTGLDAVTAEREQWDDGNNTLALAPGLVVAYERNVETNARLEEAGIEVLRIPGSELGSGRGGPRCMSCPLLRDSVG